MVTRRATRFTLPQPEDTTTTRSALRLQIVLTVFAKGALQMLEGLHGVLSSLVSGHQEDGAGVSVHLSGIVRDNIFLTLSYPFNSPSSETNFL